MKRSNLLLIFSLLLFFVPIGFLTEGYIEKKERENEKVFELYEHALPGKDVKLIETILGKRGMKENRDYEIWPDTHPGGPGGEPWYHIQPGVVKIPEALAAIAEEGIILHFFSPADEQIGADDNDFISSPLLEIATSLPNRDPFLVAGLLKIKGIKRCAFITIEGSCFGEKKYPTSISSEGRWNFEEEEKYLSALVLIETEGNISKKILRGIAVMFSGWHIPLKDEIPSCFIPSPPEMVIPYQAVRIFNEKGETLYSEIDKMRYPKEFIESQNKYIDELKKELIGVDEFEELFGKNWKKLVKWEKWNIIDILGWKRFILSVLSLLGGVILFWLYTASKTNYKVFKQWEISTLLKKSSIFLNSIGTLVKKSLVKLFSNSRELLLLLLFLTIILPLILGGRPKIQVLFVNAYCSNSVSFSPDGKYIASGNEDGTVDLWNVSCASYFKTFKGHLGAINFISFSPDGRYIAGGSDDKTIKLWDVDTGSLVKTFKGYSDTVTSISFSPDGKYIAGGSLDGTIKLWDIKDGSCIKTIKAYPREGVTSISFSPQGKYIASATEGDTPFSEVATDGIKLWDIKNNSCVRIIGRTDIAQEYSGGDIICFSPDGEYIASGYTKGTGDVLLWRTHTGSLVRVLKRYSLEGVKAICFSYDGKYIGSATMDLISLWETETGIRIQELEHNGVRVNSICFSPGGRYIVSGNEEGIDIWRVVPKSEFILRMVNFKDGQWVCYTKDGFYNCSPDGEKYISFSFYLRYFPAKIFKAIFNRPDIIIKRLSEGG